MTLYEIGERVQIKGLFGIRTGTITRVYGGRDLPYRVQYDDGGFVFLASEDMEPVAATPAELTDFLDAAERPSDLLASVQTEENDATIIEQKFVDAMAGIQEFFDARPEVRRSFGGGSKVDKNLIAYASRLEEENRALQAANRRLQDKLADDDRLFDRANTELRNEVEWLRAEAEAYLEVLQAVADDTLWTDARNAAADVINDYSPENTARPRR